MTERATRTFVGVGYEKGNYTNWRLNKEKLMALPVNEKGDIMLTQGKYKTKGKADFWMAIDDWSYNKKTAAGTPVASNEKEEINF
jgi:hypothetical protein